MTSVAARVVATDAALDVLGRLTATYGSLLLFLSGGCCDGSSPICIREPQFAIGPHDLLLGVVGGTSFYIDAEQYERWNEPALVLDVSDGPAEGFSLEGLLGVHFVVRSPVVAPEPAR